MDVLVKCSQCLQELHDTEVVHRDVKPENFLLSTNGDYKCGRVVVCDFGLSTICGSSKSSTTSGGTTSYKAPEIVRDTCQKHWEKKVLNVGCVCKVFKSLSSNAATGMLPFAEFTVPNTKDIINKKILSIYR